MKQLKVHKKDILLTNLCLFIGLSLVFTYLEYAYRFQLSPFSSTYFLKSFMLFWPQITIGVWLAYAILSMKDFALKLFMVFTGFVIAMTLKNLAFDFNKLILITLFFYVIASHFLYQMFRSYLSLSFLNPNFSIEDLHQPMLTKIPCEILVEERNMKAYLTNWDEYGCFVRLEDRETLPRKLKVKVSFHARDFHHDGEVVAETPDGTGIGIKFKLMKKEVHLFSWQEFNQLLDELGYTPERLR